MAVQYDLVVIGSGPGGQKAELDARHVIIATGTTPAHPERVDFDNDRVLDSDQILEPRSIPASMVVVGAGVIGIEHASMFAALGAQPVPKPMTAQPTWRKP